MSRHTSTKPSPRARTLRRLAPDHYQRASKKRGCPARQAESPAALALGLRLERQALSPERPDGDAGESHATGLTKAGPKAVMRPTTMPWAALLLPQVVGAATVTWLGGTGRWKEPRFWDTGAVPASSDTVVIRQGTVYLTEDRSIANLEVTDAGSVVLATTECPEGWAVLRRDSNGNSEGCAKAFSDARSWNDAELDCRVRGPRRRLARKLE